MVSLKQLFQTKEKTLSFEVFPTSTPEAYARLLATLKELCDLKPDFISCTYGAGGGNRDKTFDVVEHIQKTYGIAAMAHLTCVLHSRSDIRDILQEFGRRGIGNVLALRGDPPKDKTAEGGTLGDFKFSCELVAFIRSQMDPKVSIGVAGFPETHLLAPDADADARYLKAKIDAGADFVITQLFFDNRRYFDYVERLRSLGVRCRVIPGILPVTDYAALKRFCERCGAVVTKEIHDAFASIADDPVKSIQVGVDFAVRQCRDLLKGGAPGIHFYTLNKSRSVREILQALEL